MMSVAVQKDPEGYLANKADWSEEQLAMPLASATAHLKKTRTFEK